jgi:hypothetical protein
VNTELYRLLEADGAAISGTDFVNGLHTDVDRGTRPSRPSAPQG